MISIAIVEDDNLYRERIKEFFKRFTEENKILFNVQFFSDGLKFLNVFEAHMFDVVFLDIQMPGIDGIKTATSLREIDKDVILIFETNMAQYALAGYTVDALDFMVKPYTYDDFVLKLKKAMRFIHKDEYIFVNGEAKEKTKIFLSTLVYIESEGHYITFYTVDGKELKERGKISDLEERLWKRNFFKCNNGCLVNLRYVSKVKEDSILVGGINKWLPISRRRKKEFIDAFNSYVGGLL